MRRDLLAVTLVVAAALQGFGAPLPTAYRFPLYPGPERPAPGGARSVLIVLHGNGGYLKPIRAQVDVRTLEGTVRRSFWGGAFVPFGPLRVVVVLKESETIQHLVITWPSGRRQLLVPPAQAADLEVHEP